MNLFCHTCILTTRSVPANGRAARPGQECREGGRKGQEVIIVSVFCLLGAAASLFFGSAASKSRKTLPQARLHE